jgi:hypothetical protein
MKRLVFVIGFACWSSVAVAQSPSARQSEIRGSIVDTAGVPLIGVEVAVAGKAWRGVTRERGEFRLARVEPGTHLIVARRAGFSPESVSVTLAEAGATDVRIVLRPVVAKLDEIVVREDVAISARLEGFERRRQRRMGGNFITREEIERRAPLVTADLLRRMQGFKIVDSGGVAVAVSTRGPKPHLTGRQPMVNCVFRVGLDGFLTTALSINSITPRDIYGIEIYSGAASIPPEFGGARPDVWCGLIMIWTR